MTLLASQPPLAFDASPRPDAPSHALEQLSVNDLRDLMESVTQTTHRLQTTHIALHDQVGRLQRELAEANAALRRSQALAALGEMAAGIAHEVRNPLASIQLYAQMLREDLGDRPDQAELCGRIDRAVVVLDAIVRDVLSFARETRLEPHNTSSTELFESALQSCAALVAGNAVTVSVEEEPRLSLEADAGLLAQALSNVMRNGIEAMAEHAATAPGPRRAHLRLWAQRRRWRDSAGRTHARIALCVQDSGPGIAPAVRERMFNPFFTTRKTGTGLGLAIVHRIVDAHGGHIEIDNVKPHGARIALCLPLRRPPSSSS